MQRVRSTILKRCALDKIAFSFAFALCLIGLCLWIRGGGGRDNDDNLSLFAHRCFSFLVIWESFFFSDLFQVVFFSFTPWEVGEVALVD